VEGEVLLVLVLVLLGSHREQSTPLALQELTPLTVEKANGPALAHVGLSSPQQALPHADCESHLMSEGCCVEEVVLDSHRQQSTPLTLQELTPLTVIKTAGSVLVHVGLAVPQQALPYSYCESHLKGGVIGVGGGVIVCGAKPQSQQDEKSTVPTVMVS
jgi:hypothetical protein